MFRVGWCTFASVLGLLLVGGSDPLFWAVDQRRAVA